MTKSLLISVKMLGKKHAILENIPQTLPPDFPEKPTLRDLLTAIVTRRVAVYNVTRGRDELLSYLAENDITAEAKTGKIDFGAICNREKVSTAVAVRTALQAFDDGLYYVFIDRQKVENADAEIHLQENSELLFLRLTALVGSYF